MVVQLGTDYDIHCNSIDFSFALEFYQQYESILQRNMVKHQRNRILAVEFMAVFL
jgi:hypothetical protein